MIQNLIKELFDKYLIELQNILGNEAFIQEYEGASHIHYKNCTISIEIIFDSYLLPYQVQIIVCVRGKKKGVIGLFSKTLKDKIDKMIKIPTNTK